MENARVIAPHFSRYAMLGDRRMTNEPVACIQCDYALGLMKEKGFQDIGNALVRIGSIVASNIVIDKEEKRLFDEAVVYLIQNISYGTSPPITIVKALVKLMVESSTRSEDLHRECEVLQQLIERKYA